jgi:hypothetical protein
LFLVSSLPSFPLVTIDGVDITIAERIAALQAASSSSSSAATARDASELEAFRLELSLERMHASPAHTISLDLARCGLSNVAPLAAFVRLEVLSLADNALRTLGGQGLSALPALRELDLRRNRLESLAGVLDALAGCHALQVLHLADAVPGHTDASAGVEAYAVAVCSRLRGLVSLDGAKNPVALKALQRDAQEFLWQLARIGPNQLHCIDVSEHNIPSTFFFQFLAALAEVRLCTSLVADQNPWHTGVTRVPHYRAYIIYAIGEHLTSLDREPVIADELRNALQFVEEEQTKGTCRLVKGGWRACREQAMLAARQFRVKRTAALASKQRRGSVSPGGVVAGRSHASAAAAAPASTVLAIGEGEAEAASSSNLPAALFAGDGGGGGGDDSGDDDDDDLLDDDEAKRQADDGPGFWDVGGGGANDAELSANVNQVWSTMASVTGSILTKFEIIISYFQVYALYLVIDLKIPWPGIWLAFSRFVYFFSFNIDIAFNFDIPYKEEIKFGILVCIPLLFFLFYQLVDRLKADKWIERYSNDWQYTKRRAVFVWFVFMVLAFFGALFYDYPTSYYLVFAGRMPVNNTSGLVVVCCGIVTFCALVWYAVVANFRSNFVGVDHHEFLKWWLERTFFLRKMVLFLLTVCFMPASRIILAQFVCVDGTLLAYPGQACFPTRVSVIQILAFVFGLLYIAGIPFFFYRLISQGTHIVSNAGFETRGAELRAEIARLEAQREKFKSASWKVKEYDEAIAEYEQYLQTLWANEVLKNPLPQTYLYAAYEKKWRYYKILQMMQKLAVLVITDFVSQQDVAFLKMWAGTALQGVFTVLAVALRPFSDGFESLMDISSQVVNFVNILAALGVSMAWLSDSMATIGLFVFNIAAMAFFTLNMFATPIRACLAQRELLALAAKAALDAAADGAADAMDGAAGAASAASEAIGGAANAAGSAVGAAGSAVSSAARAAAEQVGAPHIDLSRMPSMPHVGIELGNLSGAAGRAIEGAAHGVGRAAGEGAHAVAAAAAHAARAAEAIGGAAVDAAVSGAHAAAAAAPELLREGEVYAREALAGGARAVQSDAARAGAASADAAVGEASGASANAVRAAAQSGLAAQALNAAQSNAGVIAEFAFEKGVASHSSGKDDELVAKFEHRDGSTRVRANIEGLLNAKGGNRA